MRSNKSGSKIPPRFSPGGDVKVTKTRDGGKTWSEPQVVHAQRRRFTGMPKVIANRITAAHANRKLDFAILERESGIERVQTTENAQLSRCVSLQRPGKDLATERKD